MTSFLSEFLCGAEMPAIACARWGPGLVALHMLSDLVFALSYLGICGVILVLLRRRRDLSRGVQRIAWLFIVFIVLLSLTRLAPLVALWTPTYRVQGVLKAVTALFAAAVTLTFWRQIPRLLRLPSPRDLARANLALVQANASLEATVAWRTYELEQVRRRFEQALSRSDITVFTQDVDLRYTWIHNPRFGMADRDVLGRTTEEILPGGAVDEALPLKRRALDTGDTASAVISVPTGNNGRLYFDMTVSPSRDQTGQIDGVLCTAVDVTEQRLFEVRLASMAAQLAAAYQRFELALENSPITVFEQDCDLRYTYIYNPPPGMRPEDFLGRTDFELFPEQDQRKFVPAKRRVCETRNRESLEFELPIAGTLRFYDLRLEASVDESGEVDGIVGTAFDLTERRRGEKQMRLVMRELTHRSKNLLAVVQAMARKTASLSDDVDGFVNSFSSRLRAIAAAHDLLVTQSWAGAELGELLRATLAQTVDPDGGQIRMSGPRLVVTPDTAQNLGLAFHELVTNATKYGGLSDETGRLTVDWVHADGEVRIRWVEAGGPPVAPPDRRGFGRVLLERLIGATLNGSVALDFKPGGLECSIIFPEERLIGNALAEPVV